MVASDKDMDWGAVLEQAIVKETVDLLRTWQQDPGFVKKYYPELVSRGPLVWSVVREYAELQVRRRYVNGKCTLCDGDATKCAPRHGIGRSCF